MYRRIIERLLDQPLEGDDHDLVFNLMSELENLWEFQDRVILLGLVKTLLGQGLLDPQAVAIELANWRYARVVCKGEVALDYVDVQSGEVVQLESTRMIKTLLVIDLVRLRND